MNKFICVSIHRFNEQRKHKIKYLDTVDELKKECDEDNGSTFELLRYQLRRIYLDIENIPRDDIGLIYDIIENWCDFLGISKQQYAFTKNEGSHHEGLSYHVFFPVRDYTGNIFNAIRNFKLKYPNYSEYIDETVYGSERLFRLPEQYSVLPYNMKYSPRNEIHHIVRGNFEDCIIQNISNLPQLEKSFQPVTNFTLKRKGIFKKNCAFSGPRKPTTEMVELYNNLFDKQNEIVMSHLETVRDLHNANSSFSWSKCVRDVIICGMFTFIAWTLLHE